MVATEKCLERPRVCCNAHCPCDRAYTASVSSIAPTVAIAAPMREFLVWMARSPRTYADAMAAWASHCPRFTVWEDALAAGLVQIDCAPGVRMDDAVVSLTPLGRSALPD